MISVHTLKPLDVEGIKEVLTTHERIIVIEEMVQHGGLGEKVRAIASKITDRPPITTRFLRDEFSHVYGTHDDLIIGHDWTMSERDCNA